MDKKSVEANTLQSDSQHAHSSRPHFHEARLSERFGFKPPQQDLIQPSHSYNKTREEATQRSSNHDQFENGAHANYMEYDEDLSRSAEDSKEDEDDPAFNDAFSVNRDDNDDTLMELGQDDNERDGPDVFDVLELTQKTDGTRLLPRLVYQAYTSSHRHSHVRAHLKPPSQHPPRYVSCRRSLENACTSSSRLEPSQCAPQIAPSEKYSAHVRPQHHSAARSKSPNANGSRGSTRGLSPHHSTFSSSRIQPPSRGRSLSWPPPKQHDHVPSPTPTSGRSHSHSCTPDQHHQPKNRGEGTNKQTNPSKLRFYPPCWQAFLQAAKLEMRLQAVLTHPVPEHPDTQKLVREVLDAVLWKYHSKKIKMEKGYFPEYSAQMSRLLCDDLFTFHMELKKVIISIAKQLYGIFPKGGGTRREAPQKHVADAASKLIKSGEYLQIPDSSDGKYKNFVSQVLKDACHDFYYGNSKKALKLTNEFQCSIPINSLILVAAVTKGVITGFRDTGTDKVPDLSADRCRSDFNAIQKSVDKLMENPEHRQELDEMLEEWAEYGMMDELQDDSDGASGSEDVNIIM
ncbi:hypothetical protein EV702DRAFT_1193807 [Suillus placidus]|uniref:DUF6532 domain-containing protein n=1 Tax=Suillus placidus TaxID=48579 RepID=A0A9P7A3B1_9AGAM|nr:hypothetical protein EV702DRAFT_1193807 [Suillus placidus]